MALMRAVNTIAPRLRLCRSERRVRHDMSPLKRRVRHDMLPPDPRIVVSDTTKRGSDPLQEPFSMLAATVWNLPRTAAVAALLVPLPRTGSRKGRYMGRCTGRRMGVCKPPVYGRL